MTYYFGYVKGKLGYHVDRPFGVVSFKSEEAAQAYINRVEGKNV